MSKRERIEDFFASGDDYEDALETALENAQFGSDVDFISQLAKGWREYGLAGYLSERQYQRLCGLAGIDP